MKKILLLLTCLFFISAYADTIKGGVVHENYIPSGFFGSWGVISKLKSSNKPDLFNFESRDVWTLSGYNNILILENLESGAKSEIKVNKSTSQNTLKFQKEKITNKADEKIKRIEIVEFKLNGNFFSGTDEFIIEKYTLKNTLKERIEALYTISGVKIMGESPK